jgi:hypothetical protein
MEHSKFKSFLLPLDLRQTPLTFWGWSSSMSSILSHKSTTKAQSKKVAGGKTPNWEGKSPKSSLQCPPQSLTTNSKEEQHQNQPATSGIEPIMPPFQQQEEAEQTVRPRGNPSPALPGTTENGPQQKSLAWQLRNFKNYKLLIQNETLNNHITTKKNYYLTKCW